MLRALLYATAATGLAVVLAIVGVWGGIALAELLMALGFQVPAWLRKDSSFEHMVAAVAGPAVVLVWIVCALRLVRSHFARPRAQVRLRERLGSLFSDTPTFQPIFVSRDGRFGAVLIMPYGELWGPSHELYNECTIDLTPGPMKSLVPDRRRLKLIFVQASEAELSTLPAELTGASVTYAFVISYHGLRRLFYVVLKWINSTFSELEIPWVTLIFTGISAFFLNFIRHDFRGQTRAYFHRVIQPMMEQGTPFRQADQGLQLRRLELKVRPKRDGQEIVFFEDLIHRKPEDVDQLIGAIKLCMPFATQCTIQFDEPRTKIFS